VVAAGGAGGVVGVTASGAEHALITTSNIIAKKLVDNLFMGIFMLEIILMDSTEFWLDDQLTYGEKYFLLRIFPLFYRQRT
jgi:hypothetical protein